MSVAPTEATPSPIPHRPRTPAPPPQKPIPKPDPQLPTAKKLRIQCNDLCHKGTDTFFRKTNPGPDLQSIVDKVVSTLYTPTDTKNHIPPVRSVTLILEDMGGVAYTKGMDLDDDHKEIHLCLSYIDSISSQDEDRIRHEIIGVLIHEMVHCWQWNGKGTCPGGLIEGIADFVRLRSGYGAAHWKETKGKQWDAGYQNTGYFLDWIEKEKGTGSVRRINGTLQHSKYDETEFWQRLFGEDVNRMWKRYQQTIGDGDDDEEKRLSNQSTER